MAGQINLSRLTDSEILKLYASSLDELRERNLIRTNNNPVADLAEKTITDLLNLERAPKEAKGYDAIGQSGVKYQIKGRRITHLNPSRQLGVIRNLDEGLFDYLVAAVFDEAFNLKEIWKIPHATIIKYARWSEHTHGHILTLRGELMSDPKIKNLLGGQFGN